MYVFELFRGVFMEWRYQNIGQAVKVERIYSIFERTYGPDYNFAGETHNFWECLYVQSGLVRVTADSRVYNLGEGDIIFHKPLELHKFVVEGGEKAKVLCFSFSLDGEPSRQVENKVFSLGAYSNTVMQAFLDYLHNEAINRRLAGDDWGDINWWHLLGEDMSFGQMVASYICQLVLTLSQTDNRISISGAADAELFGKAVDYMKLHIESLPAVTEIAEYLGVSVSGVQRIFDKYAKMGAHKYLISLKMKTATELLGSGVSVCEAARRLGYSSQNYFSAAFKRETGKSPSKIKR